MRNNGGMPKNYLTPEDVAEQLKLCVETIRRYLRSGKLRGVHVNPRCWRIAENDLELFVQRNANGR